MSCKRLNAGARALALPDKTPEEREAKMRQLMNLPACTCDPEVILQEVRELEAIFGKGGNDGST